MTHPGFARELAQAHIERFRPDAHGHRRATRREPTEGPVVAGARTRRPWAFDHAPEPVVLDDPAGYSVLDDEAVQEFRWRMLGTMGPTWLGGGLPGPLVWLLVGTLNSLRDSIGSRRTAR